MPLPSPDESMSEEEYAELEFVDAMILGDTTIEPDEFDLFEGTNVGASGRTDSFLLYAGGKTTRGLAQDSVPYRDPRTSVEPKNLTPYERFILDMVDGQHTVEELRVSAGLEKQEMMTTMLTLADKALICFAADESELIPDPPPTIDQDQNVVDSLGLGTGLEEDSFGDTAAQQIPNIPNEPTAKAPKKLVLEDVTARQRTELENEVSFVDAKALLTSTSRNMLVEDGESDEEKAITVVNHIEKVTSAAPTEEALMQEAPPLHLDSPPTTGNETPVPLPPSQNISIPAAITELGDVYVSNSVGQAGNSFDYDFGEDENEKSLSLGLSEEAEAFSELELLNNVPLEPNSQLDVKNDSLSQVNDAVALAMDELADELSLEDAEAESHELFSDDEELELSDDFSSLEQRLKGIKTPIQRKPSIKLEPIEELPLAPMRLDSQFIKAITEPPQKHSAPKLRRRGVIKEVDRRHQVTQAKESNSPKQKQDFTSPKTTRPDNKITGAEQAKAEKLFAEALADRAAKNFGSAKMKIKLALTFDPDNPLYKETLDSLSAAGNEAPNRNGKAMTLYQKATVAEKDGRVDEAVELLREALKYAKDAPIYNRLGVLLAMRKFQYKEARELIETAIRKDAANATYQHNLKKILAMQASVEVDRRAQEGKQKKGLLGFLSRRKKK
ncbi:MAG: tetratricopeptide repeat protein [Myxococcota bacterium]|nr:tetratricopeptide repeat protein [Myxococcota bacterium]